MYADNKNDLLGQKYDNLSFKAASFLYHLENKVKPSLEDELSLHAGTVEHSKGFIMVFNFVENGKCYQIHKNVCSVKDALKAANISPLLDKSNKLLLEEFAGTSVFSHGPNCIVMAKTHSCEWDIEEAKQDAQTIIDVMKQEFPAAVRRQILNPFARKTMHLI